MKLTLRHQMLATAVALLCLSSLAVAHVGSTGNEAAAATLAAAPTAPQIAAVTPALAAEPAPLNERHVACIAKVVHHEAANQPRKGQIAVAHVMINRVNKGFASSVCAVARQPGQFFAIDRYNPDRSSQTWQAAEDVARAVLAGETEDHSKGALFFHANWARRDAFFRTRTRTAQLEDHDFFR